MVKTRKSRIVERQKKLLVCTEPGKYCAREVTEYIVQVRIFMLWVRIKTFFDIHDDELAKGYANDFLSAYKENK